MEQKDNRPILLTGMGGVLGEGLSRGGLLAALQDAPIVLAGRTRPAAWSGSPWVECDLRDATRWARLLEQVQPRAVLYAAALARIDDCEASPELALRVQHEAVQQLGAWSQQEGARLIYVSTDQVFDGLLHGYDESQPVRPLHHYGRSKVLGEQSALASGGAVVRLPLLLGPRVSERQVGADTAAVEAALAGRSLQLFVDEFRAPADPAHFVDAFARLLQGAEVGVFHLAGADWVSRWELADLACGAAGVAHEHRRSSLKDWQGDPRPPHLALSCARAVRELGFQPPDLRQSLARLSEAH